MAFNGDESTSERQTPKESSEHEIIACDTLSPRDQRAVIFHLLYMADIFEYGTSFAAITDDFSRGFLCDIDRDGALYQKAANIVARRDELDEQIKPLLHNWRFDRIGMCTKLVLRIAIWEFLYSDLDVSVVINEAIELAKAFSETDAHKFVNGILDEWIKTNRPEAITQLKSTPTEEESES